MSNRIRTVTPPPPALRPTEYLEVGAIYYRERFDTYYCCVIDHTLEDKLSLFSLEEGCNYGHFRNRVKAEVPSDLVRVAPGSTITLQVST